MTTLDQIFTAVGKGGKLKEGVSIPDIARYHTYALSVIERIFRGGEFEIEDLLFLLHEVNTSKEETIIEMCDFLHIGHSKKLDYVPAFSRFIDLLTADKVEQIPFLTQDSIYQECFDRGQYYYVTAYWMLKNRKFEKLIEYDLHLYDVSFNSEYAKPFILFIEEKHPELGFRIIRNSQGEIVAFQTPNNGIWFSDGRFEDSHIYLNANIEQLKPLYKESTVNIANTEIRPQEHEMWAEGTSEIKPLKYDITQLLRKKGFVGKNIEISFDDMQGIWRWGCDIEKIGQQS